MLFLSAAWLLALAPWGALAAWLWRRVPATHAVPARFLWGNAQATPADFALRRPPPAWACLLLAAVALGILGLARPVIPTRAVRVLLLIDPSVALAANVDGRVVRDALLARAMRSLPRYATADRRVLGPPLAAGCAYTARPTAALLQPAVDVGVRTHDVVVLLTDVAVHDPRALVVAADVPANAGIVRVAAVAAADHESAHVMATLANFGPERRATLRVGAGGSAVERAIVLPHGAMDAFVALRAPGDRIDVELRVDDDPLPGDNAATLLRTGGWRRLIVEGGVPEAASRFAAIYASQRPARPGAPDVVLSSARPDVNRSAVWLATGDHATREPPSADDHPIIRGVDLTSLLASARIASPPGDGWTTIARAGNAPVLATREAPARQIWVGFAPDPNAVMGVVLLERAIAWANGGAGPTWSGASPADVGQDWHRIDPRDDVEASHGLYADAAGRTVAVNVPAIATGGAASVGDIASACAAARRDLTVGLDVPLGVAGALLVAAAAWHVRVRVPS